MKYKKIFVLFIISVLVFQIYNITLDKKIYYFNLGDELTNKNNGYQEQLKQIYKSDNSLEKYVEYSKENYRIIDIINDIKINKKINQNQTITNALIKADITTIWIGTNDLYYKLNDTNQDDTYEYIDQMLVDIDELVGLLRKYSKEKIIFIGYFNTYGKEKEEYFKYINIRIKNLCNKNNVTYIDLNNLITPTQEQLTIEETDILVKSILK